MQQLQNFDRVSSLTRSGADITIGQNSSIVDMAGTRPLKKIRPSSEIGENHSAKYLVIDSLASGLVSGADVTQLAAFDRHLPQDVATDGVREAS